MNRRLTALLLGCAASFAAAQDPAPLTNTPPEDRAREAAYLRNIRRITYAGVKNGEAYFSPKGDTISFQAVRERALQNPFYQIYTLDLASGHARRISAGQGRTTCSYFHPAKPRILFATSHLDPEAKKHQDEESAKLQSGPPKRYEWAFDPRMDIFETDLDGANPLRLTEAEGYDAECAYSPDGTKIVFCSYRDGDGEIYTMDADGQHPKRLTEVAGYDGGPFFSPDGKRIVWRRFSPDDKVAEVWIMNADGSEARQITKLNAVAWAPYFHPGGQWLIFACNHQDVAFELYAIQPDGAGLTRITYSAGFDGLPVFSPNGRRLMWTSTRDTDHSHVYSAEIVLPDLDPAPPPPPEGRRNPLSIDRLRAHAEYLGDPGVTGPAARGLTEPFTGYLADRLKDAGLQAPAEGFLVPGPEGEPAVVGLVAPKDAAFAWPPAADAPPFVLALAPYLDADPSAVAAWLELAREMNAVAQFRGLKVPVVFAALPAHDLEQGAAAFVGTERAQAVVVLGALAQPGAGVALRAGGSADDWRLLAEQLAAVNPASRVYLLDERTDPNALPEKESDDGRVLGRFDALAQAAAARKLPALTVSNTNASGGFDLVALRDRATVALGVLYRLGVGDLAVAYNPEPMLGAARGKSGAYLGTKPAYEGDGTGVRLQSVTPDGPADRAGLKAGDKIVKLGAQEVKDAESYLRAIEALKPGEPVAVEIERAGARQTLELTPGAR
ncbi:MAG: hypothetical protein AMXMBFR7_51210 [Planctomycetota bacterium]